MRTSMQMLKAISGGSDPKERFSLRVQDGVEIYEHESVEVCRKPKRAGGPVSKEGGPRLVVAEAGCSAEPILTKSRSEVIGLSKLLGALFNPSQRDCSST